MHFASCLLPTASIPPASFWKQWCQMGMRRRGKIFCLCYIPSPVKHFCKTLRYRPLQKSFRLRRIRGIAKISHAFHHPSGHTENAKKTTLAILLDLTTPSLWLKSLNSVINKSVRHFNKIFRIILENLVECLNLHEYRYSSNALIIFIAGHNAYFRKHA